MSCCVGRRGGSDPVLLWLWCRPEAVVLIWPLGWERPYAKGAALKSNNNKKSRTEKAPEKEGVANLCAVDSSPGDSSVATWLTIRWWFLFCMRVLLPAKFSKLFKSRQDHSISFKNRCVKRGTAVQLNQLRVHHCGQVSGYRPMLEYLKMFSSSRQI